MTSLESVLTIGHVEYHVASVRAVLPYGNVMPYGRTWSFEEMTVSIPAIERIDGFQEIGSMERVSVNRIKFSLYGSPGFIAHADALLANSGLLLLLSGDEHSITWNGKITRVMPHGPITVETDLMPWVTESDAQPGDEDLAKQVLRAIRTKLAQPQWFPASRLAGWCAQSGIRSGADRGYKFALNAGWLELNPEGTHVRIGDSTPND